MGARHRMHDAALLQAPNDAGFVQVVGGHLHLHTITDGEADPAFAHFPGDGGEDEVFVLQLDAEHGSRQDGVDDAFNFDWRFFHQ